MAVVSGISLVLPFTNVRNHKIGVRDDTSSLNNTQWYCTQWHKVLVVYQAAEPNGAKHIITLHMSDSHIYDDDDDDDNCTFVIGKQDKAHLS